MTFHFESKNQHERSQTQLFCVVCVMSAALAYATGNDGEIPVADRELADADDEALRLFALARGNTPAAVNLLSNAVAVTRRHLDRATPVAERLRVFWCAVAAARDLGAGDIVKKEFLQLAHDMGLASDLGRYADKQLQHVMQWGLRGQLPFQGRI
jgi:hypothetical protein